ncbi:hypothetical protein D515_01219 [Grimontia indica]|uniref:ImpA N-terminal domain-containing protein n=1 Tax=Grimontia indica TaxID=1056512 RepID=R1IQJ4_9GAMM|nr:type VI secretion system ImpA family N-terminal domain-containing protein [Grimontia indica]EOD79747.1 hypothetical protein D515_01219 [Grimontia indica]
MIKRPISEVSSCGINAAETEHFDEVKAQINNKSKIMARVSWPVVEKGTEEILRHHSKDFRCVCYYAVAATHNRGIEGLFDGLNAIFDMCLIYWDNGFPKGGKKDARLAAFEWYIENILPTKALIQEEKDKAKLELGRSLALDIHEELLKHYGRAAPAFDSLVALFSRRIENLEAKQRASLTLFDQAEPPPLQSSTTPASAEPEAALSQKPSSKKANTPLLLMIALTFFAAFFYIIYQEKQLERLKENIKDYSIERVLTVIRHADTPTELTAIQQPLYERLAAIVNTYGHEPFSVDKSHKVLASIKEFERLYPESNKAEVLEKAFVSKHAGLVSEWAALNEGFKKARTLFANLKEAGGEQAGIIKSYQYSNTLFPLMGRINFAESEQSLEELDKAQYILNSYQYKINQLREDLELQSLGVKRSVSP